METVGDWSVEFGMGFQFVCLCKYPHVFFSATGTLVHSGPRKQHKQNNSNSNNNNKMNSIHISMEQHCPGGLTLAGQPSHVRSGLRYLAVGCCDEASRVVDITPHHIVGEVRLQDKVLGVDLEL